MSQSEEQLDFDVVQSDLEKELEANRRAREELDRKANELYRRQNELHRQKQEAERIRREEEERIKLTIPTECRVADFNGELVNLKFLPAIRADVQICLNGVYGRQIDSFTNVVRIPVDAWPGLKARLITLPNIKVTHVLGITAKLEAYYTAPDFKLDLHDKALRIQHHRLAITSRIHNLPGAQYFAEKKYYVFPLSEGWRVFEALENYTRDGIKREVVWSPEALKLVEEEIKRRAQLDTVALKTDSDIDVRFFRDQALRPFQRVGIEFVDLAKGRALIADQMGLGKTWQAIGYALLRGFRVCVVCPAHLKANWANEITNLTGEVPTVLQGREPDQFDMETLLVQRPRFVIINYDILATKVRTEPSSSTDAQGNVHVKPAQDRWLWADLINMANFDLVVVDEAHFIKNSEANRSKAVRLLKAPHRVPLTGTPVLNRPGEFWAILNWIRPELFPSEEKFVNQYTVNGKGAKNVEQLRELLKTVMIRRLKADVVSELPPLNRITQLHEMSDDAWPIYNKVLAGVYKAIDHAGNQVERNITSILVELGKLKEVCAHDMAERTAELAIELYDTELDAADSKLGNKKVLIFSQYKEVVYKIANHLGNEAICWTGDTAFEERSRLEKEFQTNPNIHFLVVSLMTGQTGLNLTAAGHVIFNDLYWTPAAHAQAEERAYGRLSNLHGADSYYMILKDTIMEWIQEMLSSKLAVINAVVEGIDDERDTSVAMAIIQKLKAAMGRT